jgi:large conductance mechanosensitive channel
VMAKFEKPAEVTTKNCGECLSEIPLAAKRCKFCAQPVA